MVINIWLWSILHFFSTSYVKLRNKTIFFPFTQFIFNIIKTIIVFWFLGIPGPPGQIGPAGPIGSTGALGALGPPGDQGIL